MTASSRATLRRVALPVSLALSCFPALADDFAHPHDRIDVGGHRLNLTCRGSGSPTVVFESPSSEAAWAWWRVLPAVAAHTRACAYDRAGFGFSDAAQPLPTGTAAVEDLHRLLAAAKVGPPYVLVGNSLGGAYVQLFAYAHPAEVAGLVLVEPMHEDEDARLRVASEGKVQALEAQEEQGVAACLAAADKGFVAGTPAMQECVVGANPALPADVGAADLDMRLRAAWWHAAADEHHAFAAVQAQLRAARKPFGDLPLVVLVRSRSPFAAPGQPQSALNKAVEAANLAMQQEVSRLSTRGRARVVPDAGHEVQEDQPGAVVQAVEDVLAQVPH